MNKTLWSLDPNERMRLLRALIHPVDWIPCKDQRLVRLAPGEHFPAAWKEDLEYLCALHDCTLEILVVPPTDKLAAACGGYNHRRRAVYLVVPTGEKLITYTLVTTWCHELAHHIQHVFYHDVRARSAEVVLAYEQEACRLSYYVYQKYLSHVISLHYNSFQVYRKQRDQQWLLQQHGL